jgi:succinyl-diaminopimelate desuccinylase
VTNLWAKLGTARPLVAFLGHTDVVPPGDRTAWQSPPFEPVVRDGRLLGRGAADMKSGLAAMIAAFECFLAAHPRFSGSIGFLVTSDEEGDAVDGTARVIDALVRRGERIDFCIVGEPSSSAALGDTIRVGRRGSLNGTARVRGVQGHVAYPDQARNPIHAVVPALAELVERRWDEGDEFFPPTGFQVSNIQSGTGATNVIPGELSLTFNFRFNTAQRPEQLQAIVADVFARKRIDVELSWQLSGMPFLTRPGRLIAAARDAIRSVTGLEPELSTSGGTSDGRFVAPTGAEVVEIGVVNASIHKIDEQVLVADIDRLASIYDAVLRRLLSN